MDDLQKIAGCLSPGMALTLQKLVSNFLCDRQDYYTDLEITYLHLAYSALQTVNSTPNAARDIGRQAAKAVRNSPLTLQFSKLGVQGAILLSSNTKLLE